MEKLKSILNPVKNLISEQQVHDKSMQSFEGLEIIDEDDLAQI